MFSTALWLFAFILLIVFFFHRHLSKPKREMVWKLGCSKEYYDESLAMGYELDALRERLEQNGRVLQAIERIEGMPKFPRESCVLHVM